MLEFGNIQKVRLPDRPTFSDWAGPLPADTETDADLLQVYLPAPWLLRAMDSKQADEFLLHACRELRRRHPKRLFVCLLWRPINLAWPRTAKFLADAGAVVGIPHGFKEWCDQDMASWMN